MSHFKFLVFFTAAFCASAVHAVVFCKGVLNAGNPVTTDVIVTAGSICTIADVNITGTVFVGSGASLVTSGSVPISGSVLKSGSGSVNLGGSTTVNGGLIASDSAGAITIGSNVNVGSLLVSDVGSLKLEGTSTIVTANGAGDIEINGGSILGGGLNRQSATGSVTLCGATVFGGISLEQVEGDFSMESVGCAPTSIKGTISVTKGKGSITIAGADTTAVDLVVTEQLGDVSVSNTKLSDISVSQLDGSLSLVSVIADSDGTIESVKSKVLVQGSMFDGDLTVNDLEGDLILDGNNFGLEDLSVVDISGFITVQNNVEFGIILTKNKGIKFVNNTVVDAEFNGNKSPVTINDNTFQGLSCVENSGLTGTGNTVETAAPGQCAAF